MPPSNNLPQQLTSFVGREREVAEVIRLLASARLFTLTGAGGSGKTRLAYMVAAELLPRFEDGIFLVSLAPIRDPSLVISTITQELGLRESPDCTLEKVITDALRDKKMLLLLDNFEQVLEAAPLVTEILAKTYHLHILVTSREALHLYGEVEYLVEPLSIPENQTQTPETLSHYDAVSLFVQRAWAARQDFKLTFDNAPAVAEICKHLDGLPLAIELAAARIKVLPPQTLLQKLDKRLHLLTGGPRDLPARQQTLRAAMDWSYDLLDESEKQLFRRLAVFIGGRTLAAIEAVCNAESDLEIDVLEGVVSLVGKSLLTQKEGAGGEARFSMLETIHEYAREKLQESGEEAELRRRHAHYFLALAEEAEQHLTGTMQQEWLKRLDEEHDNFRMALQWSREGRGASLMVSDAEEVGLRIAGALWRFWDLRGFFNEGREHLSSVLSLHLSDTSEVIHPLKAKALNGAGNLAHSHGDFVVARSLHEEALVLRRELGDKKGMAASLNNLGLVAQEQGNYHQAHTLYQESLGLLRDLRDKGNIALSLNNLGLVAQQLGDYAQSRLLQEESLALLRELGDKVVIAYSLSNLGIVAYQQGDYSQALALLEESLAISRALGDRWLTAYALNGLGGVTQAQGDFYTSHSLYKESLMLWIELEAKKGIATSLVGLGGVAVGKGRNGQPERAARLFGAVEGLLTDMSGVLTSADRHQYEQRTAVARSMLGKDVFASLLAEGLAMSMEQAIELALSDLPERDPELALNVSTTQPYPNDLTNREVEVLRLVVEGLTSAQIAQRLFLSRNTVHAHLRSIYNKAGVSTRSAAARFATEHGLA